MGGATDQEDRSEAADLSASLDSRHMERKSVPETRLWYTDSRRATSPAGKSGLMIFCVFIISAKREKLCTRHVNLPDITSEGGCPRPPSPCPPPVSPPAGGSPSRSKETDSSRTMMSADSVTASPAV